MLKAGIISSICSVGKYNSNFVDSSERGKKSVFISRKCQFKLKVGIVGHFQEVKPVLSCK